MAANAGRRLELFLCFLLVIAGCGTKKAGDTFIVSEGEGKQQVVQTEAVIADNSALEREIRAIKERLALNESMTRLIRETVDFHELRITALEKKTTELEIALKTVQDQTAAIQTSLNDINQKIASSQQLLTTNLSRTDRTKVQEQLKALEAQQAATKAQLEQLQARTMALETFRTEQGIWNAQFTEKVSMLSASINKLDERVAYAEFNIMLIDEAIDALTRSLLDVKDKIAAMEREQKRIVNHMATDQELYDTSQQILATLRAEIASISDIMSLDIEAINELLVSKEVCSAGEKYQMGAFWFVDLTCGGKIVKVLAMP